MARKWRNRCRIPRCLFCYDVYNSGATNHARIKRTGCNGRQCLPAPLRWAVLAVPIGWLMHSHRTAKPLECWQSCWFCPAVLSIRHSGIRLNSCVQLPDAGSVGWGVGLFPTVFFKIMLYHAIFQKDLCRYLCHQTRHSPWLPCADTVHYSIASIHASELFLGLLTSVVTGQAFNSFTG